MGCLRILYYCFFRLFILAIVSPLNACKQEGDINLGITNEIIGTNVVDTLTVDASTFLLDPLPTTGQGVLLVGNLYDQDLGSIKSLSYFRLSNEQISSTSLPDNASYDSLSIVLFHNGYSYGDTTKTIRFNLHRVTEDIEPYEFPIALEDDEYPVFISGGTTLLADRKFEYESQPLGSVLLTPRPNTVGKDTVAMRLDDTFGQTLFDMALNNDSRLTVQEDFVNFFKGLVLVPADEGGAVIGFKDSIAFHIHYSYEGQGDGMRVKGIVNFPIGSSSYQFNHIVSDRIGTSLAALSYQNDNISSSLTGNRTYIQGGSGIVTRLRFPSARTLVNDGLIAVNKAQLFIETDQPTHGPFPPPGSLILLRANRYGTPTSILSSDSQGGQSGYYQLIDQSGGSGKGQYIFDLTTYISSLRNAQIDDTESLLLSLPIASLMSSIDRLNIAELNGKPAIKLQVVYTKIYNN